MYAVGRIGTYITRGVSTVSGSFHPFGGAVDIVVVQQRDSSLKSSPWYVRFGKFQGVLKAKEKVVDVRVNGAESGFHMYLNPRGEAYFLREVEVEETDGKVGEGKRVKSRSVDFDFDQLDSVMDVNSSRGFSRNLGFALERKSGYLRTEGDSNRAEIAADLLEVRWSSNVSPEANAVESGGDVGEVTSGRLESSLVLHEQHFVHKPEPGGGGGVEVYKERVSSLAACVADEDSSRTDTGLVTGGEPLAGTCTKVASGETKRTTLPLSESNGESQDGYIERFTEEQFVVGDIEDTKPGLDRVEVNRGGRTGPGPGPNYGPDSSERGFDGEGLESGGVNRDGDGGTLRGKIDISRSCEYVEQDDGLQAKSLPAMCYCVDEFDRNNLNGYWRSRSSKWNTVRENTSSIIKTGLERRRQLSDSECLEAISKELKDGDGSNGVDGFGKSWSLWPFGRPKTAPKSQDSRKDPDGGNGSEAGGEKNGSSPKTSKRHVRTVIPTHEQLAAMNLTEGKNVVTFTFSTAVLGTQQIEARIFLWRWDTRIVISDVDGTITKSDVLGQFMPLVGRDWSHIGVTHLYSAIKENGYEILFLSARSISQAHITRQFLFNLKQDGKPLPDGPVVISPDGLFPSLFREVIRRAPHEFKIACLEDIRECFPADCNPFYAGFGNRDTDEFSYLKVGIPKGKIFIINPKGEVAVNRRVDSRSYTSLHALVDNIFPPPKPDPIPKPEPEPEPKPEDV